MSFAAVVSVMDIPLVSLHLNAWEIIVLQSLHEQKPSGVYVNNFPSSGLLAAHLVFATVSSLLAQRHVNLPCHSRKSCIWG